jgi:3-oxoacyl-[acyl-carrier-protein] synthase II
MNVEAFKKLLFASKSNRSSGKKRIAITGIGVVAPNGIGKNQFWEGLSKGISGIKPISLFDTQKYHSKKAGEIANFKPSEYLGKKGLRTLDRSAKLMNVATKLAMQDGGIQITETNTYDTGVVIGTSMGSVSSISEFDKIALSEGPSFVNPAHFPNTVINSPASQVSIMFDIRGLNATITNGFCSSLDAAIYAYDLIMLNRVSMIFAGAVEELCHHTFLGFYKLGCLAGSDLDKKGIEQSMPFDKRRNEMVLGEGAACLVFEDLQHARKRGATIYGEISGYARSFDTKNKGKHNPKAVGPTTVVMNEALKNAGLLPEDIDLICSGANASVAGDKIETLAIKKVFGKGAYQTPITAIKSMLGDGYGVTGTFQIIAGLLAIHKGIIPPTINYLDADPSCDLDYVPNESRSSNVKRVIVNCFNPHGSNTSIIIKNS